MKNEEKAKELYSRWCNCNEHASVEYFLLEMARWKDEQGKTKWHKIEEGDLPKENGNYWCKLKGDYQQGSSHYKQHCKDGYCILQWLNKAQKWNVKYNTEVEAWMELPKYNEE